MKLKINNTEGIREINNGLIDLLKKDGFKNISEAVGKEVN